MRLAEAQALFHALATGDTDPSEAERLLRPTPGLAAVEGARLYAEMYRARLVEALRVDHRLLARALGEEGFRSLGEAYARACPSRHHDLGRFGAGFAAFMGRSSAGLRPDLPDLAALEWARAEVFVEADARSLGRAALAGLAPDGFAGAVLRLVPSLRRVAVRHDACRLWSALEREAALPAPVSAPGVVAVWRRGVEVFHAALPAAEASALARAAAGGPLAEVCAAFEGPGAADEAFAALASWLDEGWVASVTSAPDDA